MQYKINQLTVNINIEEGDWTGYCSMEIPFKHKEFFKDVCGFEKNPDFTNNNYEHVFSHEYGEVRLNSDKTAYFIDSADIMIMYFSWILTEGPQEITVNYPNPFWLIHDIQHALYDESGCTIYVSKEIESERLIDALDLMKSSGYTIEYELFEEVKKAFKDRFGDELKVCEEDYLEFQYEEDE